MEFSNWGESENWKIPYFSLLAFPPIEHSSSGSSSTSVLQNLRLMRSKIIVILVDISCQRLLSPRHRWTLHISLDPAHPRTLQLDLLSVCLEIGQHHLQSVSVHLQSAKVKETFSVLLSFLYMNS